MSIPAVRFKYLSNDTNIATQDFSTISSSDILNSVDNAYKQLDATISDFLTSNNEIKIPDIKSAISDAIRDTKSAFGSIKDLAKFDVKAVEGMVSDLFPNNSLAKSLFNQLTTNCKKPALTYHGLGKPYNSKISCNGKSKKAGNATCNSSSVQLTDLLNKATNGAYQSTYTDLNKILNNVMALGSLGYNANMCGVFNALTNGITDNNLLSRASAGLMATLSTAGNTSGILDVINSSAGLSPLLEFPKAVSGLFDSLTIPDEIKQCKLSAFSDQVVGGAELLNSNWNISATSGSLSISVMGNIKNPLNNLLSAKTLNNVFSSSGLDSIPNNDSDYMCTAVAARQDIYDNITPSNNISSFTPSSGSLNNISNFQASASQVNNPSAMAGDFIGDSSGSSSDLTPMYA